MIGGVIVPFSHKQRSATLFFMKKKAANTIGAIMIKPPFIQKVFAAHLVDLLFLCPAL